MVSCSCCTLRVLLVTVILCTVLFIVSLVLAFKAFPDILYFEVNKGVRLEKDTSQYDRFVELPFPVSFSVYLFHIENSEEILTGAKPNITEVGPYVYKQTRRKTVLYTDSEEDVIAYTQQETFEFDAAASSPRKEDDRVIALNAPLMSIYQIAEPMGVLVSAVVDNCIKSTFQANYGQIFINISVRELLFDGLNFCRNTEDNACSYINNIVCKQAATKRNVDVLEDSSLRFSYLNYKQKEPDGKYVVKRGIDDIEQLGHIVTWNDMKYTHYWGENTTCSEVKGTDSTVYPPRVKKDNSFFIYATDICRFVEINFIGEATYKDVDGYMFGTDVNTLQSSHENPDDDCYCSKLTKDINGKDSCFLDGIIDMQTCFGAPVLFSFPHFLWANEKYGQGVNGLNPQEDLHKIFLLVEPNTGTPLQGFKRIQLNGVVRIIPGINTLHKAAKVVLPLLWIEEGISLPDKYMDELNSSYFDKVQILEGFKWALIVITALLTIAFGGLLVRKKYFQKK